MLHPAASAVFHSRPYSFPAGTYQFPPAYLSEKMYIYPLQLPRRHYILVYVPGFIIFLLYFNKFPKKQYDKSTPLPR